MQKHVRLSTLRHLGLTHYWGWFHPSRSKYEQPESRLHLTSVRGEHIEEWALGLLAAVPAGKDEFTRRHRLMCTFLYVNISQTQVLTDTQDTMNHLNVLVWWVMIQWRPLYVSLSLTLSREELLNHWDQTPGMAECLSLSLRQRETFFSSTEQLNQKKSIESVSNQVIHWRWLLLLWNISQHLIITSMTTAFREIAPETSNALFNKYVFYMLYILFYILSLHVFCVTLWMNECSVGKNKRENDIQISDINTEENIYTRLYLGETSVERHLHCYLGTRPQSQTLAGPKVSTLDEEFWELVHAEAQNGG